MTCAGLLHERGAELLERQTGLRRPISASLGFALVGMEVERDGEAGAINLEERGRPSHEQPNQPGVRVRELQTMLSLGPFRPVGDDAGDPERVLQQSRGFDSSGLSCGFLSFDRVPLASGRDFDHTRRVGPQSSQPPDLRCGQFDVAAPARQRSLRHGNDRGDLLIGEAEHAKRAAEIAALPALQVRPTGGALQQRPGKRRGKAVGFDRHASTIGEPCDK
ncbi:MAG TPA: hypothetical protein VGB64_08840 [Actinomycetota bacterium]